MPAFQTAYSDDALLAAVRDVTAHLGPTDPLAVPPAAFDAARAGAGHPRLPAAKQISRRLRRGWYAALELAHAPGGADDAHGLGLHSRDEQQQLELDDVVIALRIAARRAELQTIWPARYDAEREAIAAAQRRAHRHGAPAVWMPPAQQIERQVGWDEALAAAGLERRTGDGGRRGVPMVEVMDRFVDDVGALPWSLYAIDDYARVNDISVSDLGAVAPRYGELRARRTSAGKWTPPAPPPRGHRPSPKVRSTSAPAAPPRLRYWTDLQSVVDGVAEAYRRAGSRTLTQRLHRQLAAESAGAIPAPSVVERIAKRHGTTAAAVRDAARASLHRAAGADRTGTSAAGADGAGTSAAAIRKRAAELART